MVAQYTLVANDIQYLSFYLKEKDPVTGSITPYTLASASSIVFRMREYGNTVNTLSVIMQTVETPSNTLGFCRVFLTIPAAGHYHSEIEVYDGIEELTWIGHTYKVVGELG